MSKHVALNCQCPRCTIKSLKAQVKELTKVIKMLKIEAECTTDKYLRGAILRRTVAALKKEGK